MDDDDPRDGTGDHTGLGTFCAGSPGRRHRRPQPGRLQARHDPRHLGAPRPPRRRRPGRRDQQPGLGLRAVGPDPAADGPRAERAVHRAQLGDGDDRLRRPTSRRAPPRPSGSSTASRWATPVRTSGDDWSFTWSIGSSVPDGVYLISAKGYNSAEQSGNSKAITRQAQPLPADAPRRAGRRAQRLDGPRVRVVRLARPRHHRLSRLPHARVGPDDRRHADLLHARQRRAADRVHVLGLRLRRPPLLRRRRRADLLRRQRPGGERPAHRRPDRARHEQRRAQPAAAADRRPRQRRRHAHVAAAAGARRRRGRRHAPPVPDLPRRPGDRQPLRARGAGRRLLTWTPSPAPAATSTGSPPSTATWPSRRPRARSSCEAAARSRTASPSSR